MRINISATLSAIVLTLFGIVSGTIPQANAQVYLEDDPPLTDTVALAEYLELQYPDLGDYIYSTPINKSLAPRVFHGFRHLESGLRYSHFPDPDVASQVWRDSVVSHLGESEVVTGREGELVIGTEGEFDMDSLVSDSLLIAMGLKEPPRQIPDREDLPVAFGSATPDWLRRSMETYRFQEDFTYRMMLENPSLIEYAYWDLPVPPRLPQEDTSLQGYLRRLDLPEIATGGTVATSGDSPRINWLHTFNIALQLSQAYVSKNWYQGGNSYLSFLGNFLWDVQLNNVYYPKIIFQSTLAYKLAINSTPEDQYHKYSVSQDLFQYNLKAGYKAVHNWYYSFLMQFKTQFLNSYPANSEARNASFLSPGELNLGLGMTYSKEKEDKSLKFSASVSPVSYNLKVCIDDLVDRSQFNIKPGRKWLNEVGSNAEVNFFARLWGNVTYTTRLFFFTDYKLLQGDWENTLNFQFSKLFSTQIYAHLRYDSSADSSIDRGWRKLMLKEILSVGISYTFSTK